MNKQTPVPQAGFRIWILVCVVIFGRLAIPAFAGEPVEKYFFKDMAQDGQGVVWGIDTKLMVFNGREWVEVSVAFPKIDIPSEALPGCMPPMQFPHLFDACFFTRRKASYAPGAYAGWQHGVRVAIAGRQDCSHATCQHATTAATPGIASAARF